mmetsp:Transcript_22442/g.62503  ORF Transcript_22442/g.62503 Transcript_22442/m.62503 type:complete len:495 (-) Transcript_22442:615-2099(-)
MCVKAMGRTTRVFFLALWVMISYRRNGIGMRNTFVEAFVSVSSSFIAQRRGQVRRQKKSMTSIRNGVIIQLDESRSIRITNSPPCSSISRYPDSPPCLSATPPQRYPENAEGPLYVNNKCINCAACSMFSPSVFARESKTEGHHIVARQPTSQQEIDESRAALAACPVAAIRVDRHHQQHQQTKKSAADPSPASEATTDPNTLADQMAINPKFNGRSLPFPRPISPNLPDVFFVGHHNSKSFGAAPYLVSTSTSSNTKPTWIMIDTPRYSKSAVRAVESITGQRGPSYLVLTHVDDTADHNRWKEKYPGLNRIFHAGDLGEHNWIGDESLESVEILLQSRSSDHSLQYFDLTGNPINNEDDRGNQDVVLVHTPGHSPGSIALLKLPTASGAKSKSDSSIAQGVLFSGDTYAYTTREGGHMSGFPRFGNDARLQSKILPLLLDLDWKILAPGHGHVRDYTLDQRQADPKEDANVPFDDIREAEMEAALEELRLYF